jgi:hypothetical protein
LDLDETTIADVFKEKGYATAAFGNLAVICHWVIFAIANLEFQQAAVTIQ